MFDLRAARRSRFCMVEGRTGWRDVGFAAVMPITYFLVHAHDKSRGEDVAIEIVTYAQGLPMLREETRR